MRPLLRFGLPSVLPAGLADVGVCWGTQRYYMYELLKALDFCHSKGIIHRDVVSCAQRIFRSFRIRATSC